ncbi:MAG: hypothetical protein ABEK17_04575 [Candidatus Aenigmatarchaeota archaeon]
MSKKGVSILPFAFIALVVSLSIISWSIYNVYFGSKYQTTVFHHSRIDTVSNEVGKNKKFLKQSCLYSSHYSLFENALGGGIIPERGTGSNTWICNAPMPPDMETTKGCVEKYTKFYTNVYFDNYTIDLPVDISKAPYRTSIHNISRGDVFRGAYDEGNINIILEGAKTTLSSDSIQITDNLDQSEMIGKNRFWYLWRKFYKWAGDNVYGKNICKCTSSCKGCDCADVAAQKALDDLQTRFDEYVTCSKACDCCYGCQGSDCGVEGSADCGAYCEPSECLLWEQRKCVSKCNMKCVDPEKRYPEASNISKLTELFRLNSLQEENTGYSEVMDSYMGDDGKGEEGDGDEGNEKCCPIYKENKLSAVYTFTCTDKKYYVPGGSGPQPLTFQVKAFATYRDKDGCGCQLECPCKHCPQNMGETC